MTVPHVASIETENILPGVGAAFSSSLHPGSFLSEEIRKQVPAESCPLGRREFLQSMALAAGTLFTAPTLRAEGSNSTSIPAAEKKWRVGVIGHSGQGNYGHGLDTCWLRIPETEVLAFADANAAGLAKEQVKLPGAKAFADYRKMLAEVQPEIVAVGPRWLNEHRDMILAAIDSGARGIYCEKPFCRTPAEADEILAACQKSGCRVALAHRNRYHPALATVQALIQQGTIGELLELRGRGKEDQRGGCLDLWVLGSHVFDLARYFAGDALTCSASIQQGKRAAAPHDLQQGAEGVGLIAGDRLHARFEMAHGLPFYFDSIRNAGVAKAGFGLQLIGNAGIIDLRVDEEPIAHLLQGNPFDPDSVPRNWVPITTAGIAQPEPITGLGGQVASHQLAGQDLLNSIRENRPALCSEHDGLAIVEMIHSIFQSHVQQAATISLPLENRDHIFEAWKTLS